MTIAMIGWFTKNLAMFYLGCELAVGADLASVIALSGLGLTVMPAFTLWIPSATTRSPGFNPSSMIHCGPIRSPTLTGLILNLVILAHYGHLVATLQLCHRALGNKEGAFFSRSDRPYASELAGAKDIPRIGKQSLQP